MEDRSNIDGATDLQPSAGKARQKYMQRCKTKTDRMVNQMKKTIALTPKQQRFCEEYMVDLNATQAAVRAGYSTKTAQEQSAQLLSKLIIQEYVAKLQHERRERVKIDSDHVLRRLVEIDQMDLLDILTESGTVRPVDDWPRIWRQYVTTIDVTEIIEGSGDERAVVGVLKKIKWPDKLKNLELIGRHVAVQAWKDVSKVEGTITVTLSPAEANL